MANRDKTYFCEKCKKTMKGTEFYSSNNLEKYPNEGTFPKCKHCMTMHVDNWNPDTYLWILEEADVPYIPEEWNKLISTFAKPGTKVTGTTILGRYLSKMKLKQFKDYRWKDTDFLREQANAKIEQTMKQQGYDAAAIASVIQQGTIGVPPPPPPETEDEFDGNQGSWDGSASDYFETRNYEEEAESLGLTEEDITYLKLKWGKTYKPEEWVQLEQLFEDMMGSYDIQSAGHIDTLKFVCKTSLKANQLLDIGDVDGAQKMIKMYDGLMKSGKFTAAQNKAEQGEYVDSISELVAICEKDGFIPRYYTDGPQDKVDRVIQDMQDYTYTLVTEEMHLGSLIEKAVKQIQDEKLKDLEEEIDDETEEEALERELFTKDENYTEDEDYIDFAEFEDEAGAADDSFYKLLMEEANKNGSE